jgi:hypothetical protein
MGHEEHEDHEENNGLTTETITGTICSTNLFYRAVLARFRAAIFLTRFRARSCEAFAPLGFSLLKKIS